jgi:hypothetical protein
MKPQLVPRAGCFIKSVLDVRIAGNYVILVDSIKLCCRIILTANGSARTSLSLDL